MAISAVNNNPVAFKKDEKQKVDSTNSFLSSLVPGIGQLRQGRTVSGVVQLGATAGMAGWGLKEYLHASKMAKGGVETTLKAATNDVVREGLRGGLLSILLGGGYLALSLYSGMDAYNYDRKKSKLNVQG